jgi:hypothetical protein
MIMSRTRAAAYTVTALGGILALVALILAFHDIQIAGSDAGFGSCGKIDLRASALARGLPP